MLGLGASQYRDVPEPEALRCRMRASAGIYGEEARTSHELLDSDHDLFCLTVGCGARNDLNPAARPIRGQCQRFCENGGRDLEDRSCEPVGRREPDDLRTFVHLREPCKMVRASTPKAVDRLIGVTNDAQALAALC